VTSLWLRLELLDDVAVSQSSATVGGHRSLDFLPGAALLGAVARRTYKALDEVTAIRLFHAGKLRFGPGLPEAADGGCTVPSPLSLHERKDGGDGELLNLAVSERPAGLQYRQVRNGFRDGELGAVMVGRRGSMRTSVTREGRAREGFLFTVNAISRGAVFLSRVDADDAQDLACVAALDGQVIRLGKSRSAEFGGVRVQVLTQPPPEGAWQCEEGRVSTLRILAVSDVALRSEVGAPTFEPTPAHLGLPGSWRWDVARSFLRTRSWSPFNAYRGRPDLERQVLSAGSVLVFTGDEAVDLSDIRARLAPGVGEGRAEGLGQVLVNPVILSNARRTPAQVDNAEAARHAPAPTGELARWVGQQHQQREAVDAAWFAAMELARLYVTDQRRRDDERAWV